MAASAYCAGQPCAAVAATQESVLPQEARVAVSSAVDALIASRVLNSKAELLAGDLGPALRELLEERGVLRAHQVVRIEGVGEGEITSGSFSPTLGKSIALARVPAATGERAEVEIRGKWFPVRVVQPNFVRNGKALI